MPTAVDYDPFAAASAATPTPVDHDPFAPSGADKALADARSNVERNNRGLGDVGRALRATGEGATLGLGADLNGAVAAGQTALENLTGHGPGYTAGDAYRATKQAVREDEKSFYDRRPLSSTAEELAGGFFTPGAGAAAKFIGRGSGVLSQMLRSAAVGAGYGGASGAISSEGGMKDRAKAAGVGALFGGAGAGAMPALGNTIRTALRGLNAQLGHPLGGPLGAAQERIAQALHADGFGPEEAKRAVQEWAHVGAGTPTLDTVAGENTRGLMRAAASKFGPARNAAVEGAEKVRENLGSEARDRVAQLSPERRPTHVIREQLEEARDRLAEEKYREPYAHPVKLTPAIMAELKDPEGRAAVNQALKAARARKDYRQVGELTAILDAEHVQLDPRMPAHVRAAAERAYIDQLPSVSGGALDRVRIALGKRGAALAKHDQSDVAAGMFDRQTRLEEHLDQVPHLKEARAEYRRHQDQIRALKTAEHFDRMNSAEFGDHLKGMSEADLGMARAALANHLGDRLSGKAADVSGSLSHLAYSDSVKAKLRLLYGNDEADRLVKAARFKLRALKTADYRSPNTGSQTQSRQQDVVSPMTVLRWGHNPLAMIAHLAQGASMSDAEREEVLKLGMGPTGDLSWMPGPRAPSVLEQALARMPVVAGSTVGATPSQASR